MKKGPRVTVNEFIFNFTLQEEDKKKLKQRGEELLESIRQDNPDGFTIGQLQAAANEVTQLLRLNGYVLAQAYIPQQQIRDGRVFVDVLIGTIGKISVEGNEKFRTKTIRQALNTKSGTEIYQEIIEGALLRVDDLPGLNAYGIFRPGSNLGEADLIVKIEDERTLEGMIVADDYGSEATGNIRLLGNVRVNNLSGYGDQFSFIALQSYEEDSGIESGDSQYGEFSYTLPITANSTIGTVYSVNDYDINDQLELLGETINLEGETTQFSVFIDYSMIRSRSLNYYNLIDLTLKKATIDSNPEEVAGLPINSYSGQPLTGEDQLTILSYRLGMDSTDSWYGGGINEAYIKVSLGIDDFLGSMDKDGDNKSLRIDKNLDRASGKFSKINVGYDRLQAILPGHSLLFQFDGQYSGDVLSSLEQLSIGGPTSVRAYPVSEYVRDRGYFSSLEWIMNAPFISNMRAFGDRTWGEILQISFYVDYAKGENNDAFASEIEISGKGVGIQLQLVENLMIRFDACTSNWRRRSQQ